MPRAAVSFGDIEGVLDDAIRVVSARWRFRGPDVEDFAQDVRLAVVNHQDAVLRRFRGFGAFTYFFRIATRVAIDRVRSRSGPACHEVTKLAFADARSADHEGEAHKDCQDVVDALQGVLAALDDDERALLAHRFVWDESARVIAGGIGGSRSATARRLKALLAEMRGMLLQVGITRADAVRVLETGIDVGLLEKAPRDPTRPDPTLEVHQGQS